VTDLGRIRRVLELAWPSPVITADVVDEIGLKRGHRWARARGASRVEVMSLMRSLAPY